MNEEDRAILLAALSAYIDLCSENADSTKYEPLRQAWLTARSRASLLHYNVEHKEL